MPILAGISVFMVGRHSIGVSRYADDADESRIVALRVVLDDEEVATWFGEWREGDSDGMDDAALECLKVNGHPLSLDA